MYSKDEILKLIPHMFPTMFLKIIFIQFLAKIIYQKLHIIFEII